MAIDEHARHRLHQRLEQVLGPEEAATLMAHMPPAGWADVATKHDVQALERDVHALELSFSKDHEALERVLKAEISSSAALLGTELANTRSALFRYSILANSATLLGILGILVATGRLT